MNKSIEWMMSQDFGKIAKGKSKDWLNGFITAQKIYSKTLEFLKQDLIEAKNDRST